MGGRDGACDGTCRRRVLVVWGLSLVRRELLYYTVLSSYSKVEGVEPGNGGMSCFLW